MLGSPLLRRAKQSVQVFVDGPKKSINAIKSDVCDTTLVVLAWLVIPALLISYSRALEIGWRPQYTGQAIAALTI